MCTGNCYRHRAPGFRSYGFGLRNLSDPWFTQKFTNIYKGPGLQVPWFSVLGSEFELQCGWGASAGLPDLHCAGCCVWVCRLWWPHSTCAPPPPPGAPLSLKRTRTLLRAAPISHPTCPHWWP